MPGRPKNRCRNRVVFEHRFFGVSASILEPLGPPRWSQVRLSGRKIWSGYGPGVILKTFQLKGILKMASWRPPGLILEAPGFDFGGPEARFGTVPERFFRDFGPECQESQERQERLPKQDLDHKCAKSGWAAVLPPRGVSIRRPPKVVRSVLDPLPHR